MKNVRIAALNAVLLTLCLTLGLPALAVQLAGGANHSLLLRDDGTLWAWGYNTYGQLGDGSNANRSAPVQVLSGVKAVAAGDFHTMAIRTDGTLWAWGRNDEGQLGDGGKTNRPAPVQV